MKAPEPIRIRVIFHGRVQGVFFRATTHALSRDFRVSGFVRNLPDGTVELEAEGQAGEIERFLAAIQARYADGIERVERATIATQLDREFVIRR